MNRISSVSRNLSALFLALLLTSPSPAQNLPGLKTGGQVAKDVALWGGIAAGAGVAYYYLFAKDGPVVAASPKRLAIQGGTGEAAEGVVRIVNTSKSAAEIRSIRVDGGIFSVETPPLPRTLRPDDVLEVRVKFAPRSARRYEAELRVIAGEAGKHKDRTLRVAIEGDSTLPRP